MCVSLVLTSETDCLLSNGNNWFLNPGTSSHIVTPALTEQLATSNEYWVVGSVYNVAQGPALCCVNVLLQLYVGMIVAQIFVHTSCAAVYWIKTLELPLLLTDIICYSDTCTYLVMKAYYQWPGNGRCRSRLEKRETLSWKKFQDPAGIWTQGTFWFQVRHSYHWATGPRW